MEDWKKEGWKFRRKKHGRLEGMGAQKRIEDWKGWVIRRDGRLEGLNSFNVFCLSFQIN